MTGETLVSYITSFPKHGTRAAFFYKTGYRTFRVSYRRLSSRIVQLANHFDEQGLKKGDRVVLRGANSPEWAICFFACLLKGLIAVPLDVRSSIEFAKKIIEITKASLVICDNPHLLGDLGPASAAFEELLHRSEDQPVDPIFQDEISPNDTAEILFTSGTTGEPKGVVLTHKNIFSNVEDLSRSYDQFTPDDKFLSLLPLSHIFEQTVGLLLPLKNQLSVTYLAVLKPSSILQAFKDDRITYAPVVPRLLRLLKSGIEREVERQKKEKLFNSLMKLSQRLPISRRRFLFPALKKKFGKLKYFVAGGAVLDEELERFWGAVGFQVFQGYGLTETSPIISCNYPGHHRFGSVGKVLSEVEMRLGKDREICVRGESVFSGYYQNQKKTQEVFEGDWFKTGDLGELDKDGFLFYRGRKEDLIVTSEGLNVYPDDLEQVLNQIEGVKESCVLGIEKEGRILIHAALLLDDKSKDPKDLIEAANRRLEDKQKIQSGSVWPDDDFPRTSTLKIKKKEVKKRLMESESKNLLSKKEEAPLLNSLIAQLAKIPVADVHSNQRIGDDLGLASLDRVELAAMIEEEMHIDIDDGFFQPETRVEEIEKLIQNKTGLKRQRTIACWPVQKWVVPFRKLLQFIVIYPMVGMFCRLRVEGRENIRNLKEPVLFIANHQSYLDAPMIVVSFPKEVRRRISIAAWRGFFEDHHRNPLMRFWKRVAFYLASTGLNIFMFTQTKGIKENMEHTGWLMDKGYHVLFFPEGARTTTGNFEAFKPGVGKMVRLMKSPVVPIAIDGLYDVWRRGTRFPKRGNTVCRFGKPIVFNSESEKEITGKLHAAVEELLK